MEPLQPLYEITDVEEAIKNFQGFDYEEEIKLTDNIKLKFHDAGHILGSAICELIISDDRGKITRVVFSGDIGNTNKDILKDPQTGLKADYLIMESTYGDRVHNDKDIYPEFLEVARSTMEAGGNLIIPCFSLGRTQEIIYMLNRFVEDGKLKGCSVYVDSPLASSLTDVFKKYEEYFDRAAQRLIAKGDDPLSFKGLHFVKTNEEAKEVQSVKEKAIIIVAGGLHDGGRVANHLKNNLIREECGIIVTSYQGRASIGSKLLKGEKNVRVSGENVEVKAKVHYIGGLSCHADKDGLFQWIESLEKSPSKVFLVHGEEENIQCFDEKLVQNGYDAITVDYMQEIELDNN
ncbi:MAG: MBL fold metallo-hydrolase [Clostridium sp.]